ncbi:GNAT family acetyltransferase [Allorhizocola rhizosphaerae]|uniref:GNAT family acetyltransferase n=1 Tax=Allorhizocola rhizosphaerae TaxID=1872709 RepID=UPI000E3B8B11|nr:GNAT family acetyltransferase [Allorhizocola rhizosphaerae]
MSLYAGALMVLILDDTRLPYWYPIQLFEVADPALPNEWLFADYGNSEHLQAIWGYEELIREESHYDALLERDADALRIFMERSQQSS